MINSNNINDIFSRLSSLIPSPKTELIYTNNFTLLVAIVLSAQSTDVGVNKATKELFKVIDCPNDLLNLGLGKLKNYIKSLGLYNNKAKNLIALAKTIHTKYDGKVPQNIQALEALPGVGSKTAAVFMNCAYHYPIIAVDTHVFRVSRRLGIATKNTPKSVQQELNSLVPDQWKIHAHHWLILHGRYICKARKPNCLNCAISDHCNYYKEQNQ